MVFWAQIVVKSADLAAIVANNSFSAQIRLFSSFVAFLVANSG